MAEARLDQGEMLRTFNCGLGMILVAAPGDVERVRRHLAEEAMVIGAMIDRGSGDAVRYKGQRGWGAP
jgi:phosphoribosylformylglycinamidine cyclo-ligase